MAIYDTADTLLGPERIYVCLCTIEPLTCGTPPYSIKRTNSLVPIVPELYKFHSIIQTLVYCFHEIACHIWWIQRPGITLTLLLIILTFLNLVRQQKDLKDVASFCSPARLRITMPMGSIPEAPKIWMPPYYGHTVVVPTVSGFEGFHYPLTAVHAVHQLKIN